MRRTFAFSSHLSIPFTIRTIRHVVQPLQTSTICTCTTSSSGRHNVHHHNRQATHRRHTKFGLSPSSSPSSTCVDVEEELPTAEEQALYLVHDGLLDETDKELFSTLSAPRAQLFAKVLRQRTRFITVVLDNVENAHNLGAIMRTLDVHGVQDVHFISMNGGTNVLDKIQNERSVHSVSKKCHKWLTLYQHTSPKQCIHWLHAHGYKVLVSNVSPLSTTTSHHKKILQHVETIHQTDSRYVRPVVRRLWLS